MPATLTVNIQSVSQPLREEIKFFEAPEWSAESEKQFLSRIQEIFSIARRLGKTFEISITIETADVQEISFLLQKKINTAVEINHQKMSHREVEVLGLIMQGLTNNEIAEKLFISYETVKSHRKNILEKSGAKNTAALINYYHQTFFEK
jgi:DNA-binding CsgD family transcriptional regulator